MELTNEYKYGFLIGMIEGEGSVYVQHIGKDKTVLVGNITIVNTDKNLIDFVDKILKSFDFKYSVRRHNTDEYIKNTGEKMAWRIVISNRRDFQKIFENYYVEGSSKKEKLRILIENRKRKLYNRRSQ
jgi:hypothetical protein